MVSRGLFFLPRYAKSFLPKFKSFIFVESISFLHGSHSFAELVHDGFVKPLRTAAFTRNIAAATLLHVSHMPAIKVKWHHWIYADFSKIIQSLWNWSLTNWDFLYSPFVMQKLPPVRLWCNSDCNHPDLW